MFEPRMLSTGRVCCSQPYALCDSCRRHHGLSDAAYRNNQRRRSQQSTSRDDLHMENYAPAPDSYRDGLAALRAAQAKPLTPSEQYEEDYKNNRRRGFELEMRAAANAEAIRTLAAHQREVQADLASYAPPDSYGPALAKLRGAR